MLPRCIKRRAVCGPDILIALIPTIGSIHDAKSLENGPVCSTQYPTERNQVIKVRRGDRSKYRFNLRIVFSKLSAAEESARLLFGERPAVNFELTENPNDNPDILTALILEIKQGNQNAAAEFCRQYEPEVRRFIRFRLTDPRLRRLFDSVDVCQSVMARFFHHVRTGRISVEHPLQLLKLLTTMARNSLLDHARKAKVRHRISGHEADPDQIPSLKDPGIAAVDQIEQADLVSLIRMKMRPEEQLALDKWMLGHGWDALSIEFNCEPDAIRKKLTRAIDRATKELGLLEDSNA